MKKKDKQRSLHYIFFPFSFNFLPCNLQNLPVCITTAFVKMFLIKEEYHYLNVSKVGTFTVYNSLDCSLECLGNPSCLSINLAAYKGADEKILCELLGSEKYSNPKQFKSNNNSHHFSIKVTLTSCLLIVNIYTMHVHEPN